MTGQRPSSTRDVFLSIVFAAMAFLTFVTTSWSVSNLDHVVADAFVLFPTASSRKSSSTGWLVLPKNKNHLFLHDDDDALLLQQVKKSQLIDLCQQYQLDTCGTKEILLHRLRDYANQQAELERKRRQERIARVEGTASASHDKERHEIVNSDNYPEEEDDDDEGFFYYSVPTTSKNTTTNATANKTKRQQPPPTYVTNSVITAPPPPPEPNEKGERVVTVYSTTDQNDLTGIASAQPGQTFTDNDLLSGGAGAEKASSATETAAPWDRMAQQKSSKATSSKELDEATEIVSELVHVLLTMTGAPAFREEFSEGLMPLLEDDDDGVKVKSSQQPSSLLSSPEKGFVGFDPSKVPTDILTQSSQALRANRGQVLQEVLREYELRAIGHDGMAGDNVTKGGGHYREVSKVRAFLEGYRRAETRRIARDTITILLNKLVEEGVEGLDFQLASMVRSSDDTNNEGGMELNDSLLDYLNDAIRQQEKKVEQTVLGGGGGVDTTTTTTSEGVNDDAEEEEDKTAQFWNVTTNEEGQRTETIDPNDPMVKKMLEEEVSKSRKEKTNNYLIGKKPTPDTAPEQLLLLLCLLRDRIKTEACFFGNDEKGRNLRILAYCLHAKTDGDRERILMKELGGSLDRLDSFTELVASSIDYAESTSQQLQPSKTSLLNVNLLKVIHDLAEEIKDKQAWKASGTVPTQSRKTEQPSNQK